MPLERPQVAMLADAVQTRYDGPPPEDAPAQSAPPGSAVESTKGAHARAVMRLLHAAAMGDYEAAGEVLADDVRFEILACNVTFPVRRAVGRAAMIEALKQNFPVVTDQQMELLAFVEDDTHCVMIHHESGRVVATGERYEGYGTFLFTFAGGRIVHLRNIAAARD